MSAFLKIFGRFGGIITLIILLITLVRQLISLVGFLLVAIKVGIVVAFVGLVLIIVLSMMRGRARRRREEADI
jgi:predicted membrane metal-binding protein